MFKNILFILILISFIGLNLNSPSSAFFFKKHKQATKVNERGTEQTAGEKKIIIAEIYAGWCPGCKNIQPTLDQLVKETSDIDLIQLDVSTPSKAQASSKLAKELNLTDFYNSNKSKTSTVGVIVRKSGEIVSLFENNNKIEDYKAAIEEAKTKDKALDNPPT